jgi:hypothetical protein
MSVETSVVDDPIVEQWRLAHKSKFRFPYLGIELADQYICKRLPAEKGLHPASWYWLKFKYVHGILRIYAVTHLYDHKYEYGFPHHYGHHVSTFDDMSHKNVYDENGKYMWSTCFSYEEYQISTSKKREWLNFSR